MIYVADTSAIVALLSTDDRAHLDVLALYRATGRRWVLPWAILPEVDYLVAARIGGGTQAAFVDDLLDGAWSVEWGTLGDVARAQELGRRYRDLQLGLVDTVVMACAERLGATAIVTLDLRHFGAVELEGNPQILPRDQPDPTQAREASRAIERPRRRRSGYAKRRPR